MVVIAVADTSVAHLQRALQQLESEQEHRESQNSQLSVDREHKEKSLEIKKTDLDQLQQHQDRTKEQILQTQAILEQLRGELAEESRKLDAKKNEYDLLKSMIDSMEGYPESVKYLHNNPSWKSNVPILSDVIYVNEEYRQALENVLEPYLSYYVVDNLADAKTIRDMRDNGKTNDHELPGTNSKMSEADCAQLIVKFRHFDRWQKRRTAIADYYTQELSEIVDTPRTTENGLHSWHKYVIKLADRTSLQHHLSKQGIETKIHYDRPLYEYEVGYPYINYVAELYREASAFCAECLSLPIYPELTDTEVERVVEEIKSWLY